MSKESMLYFFEVVTRGIILLIGVLAFSALLGLIMQNLTTPASESILRNTIVEFHKETIIKEIYLQNLTHYVYEYRDAVQFYPRQYRECGRRAYSEKITGQSMLPMVDVKKDGSMSVRVEPVQFKDLALGDAIVFYVNNTKVFHAIVYINNDYALTAGYNNYRTDDWRVYADDVVARYCLLR